MGRVVVIPQDFDDLPYAQRKLIIPICIAAFDIHGEPIAPEWFSSGVAPVRKQLVSIAQYLMGDPWCVSELVETTIHRLWAKYRSDIGLYPARRVLKKAMWVGEELMVGDWRRLKYPSLYLPLETLDGKIRDQMLADPNEYAELFGRQIMLDWVDDRLRHSGPVEMRLICQLIRSGYSWEEVAGEVGATGAEQLKRRFYRWRKREFGDS